MARFFRRRKFCRFTAEDVKEIDYKDLNTLKAYVSETGKIVPSRITGHSGSGRLCGIAAAVLVECRRREPGVPAARFQGCLRGPRLGVVAGVGLVVLRRAAHLDGVAGYAGSGCAVARRAVLEPGAVVQHRPGPGVWRCSGFCVPRTDRHPRARDRQDPSADARRDLPEIVGRRAGPPGRADRTGAHRPDRGLVAGRQCAGPDTAAGGGAGAAGAYPGRAELRYRTGDTDTAVHHPAALRRTGRDARPGGARATGEVLAGRVVRDAAAVHAADLSVARGFGHCRQPD
ncbi:hypothetical protein L1887_53791 [Cichorium endivia]|nr:hypothetical protein L1887_53791 [Cichorium endivia]